MAEPQENHSGYDTEPIPDPDHSPQAMNQGGGGGGTDVASKLMSAPGNIAKKTAEKSKNAGQMAGDIAGGGIGGSTQSGGIANKLKGGGNSNSGTLNTLKKLEGAKNAVGTNPSEEDFAKKAAHVAKDTAETAKDVAKGVRAVGGDVKAAADLAKKVAAHPIQTAKQWKNAGIFVGAVFVFQAALVGAFFLLIVFAFYKVAVMVKGVTDIVSKPAMIATEFRVSLQTATYLVKVVPELAYEKQLQEGSKKGTAIAAGLTPEVLQNNNLSKLQLNPEMQKMFATWDKANIGKTFLDTYDATFVPNGNAASQIDNFDPNAWDLYVHGENLGTVTSDRSLAFLGVFTDQTMHWRDIYTRVGPRRTVQERFRYIDGKLKFEDVGLDMEKSRTNVTKRIVTDTMTPITARSSTYYKCVIDGGSYCDGLGLGSVNSPKNCGGGFFGSVRCALGQRLMNEVDTEALGKFAAKQNEEVKDKIDGPTKRTSLVGLISTGASDTILDAAPKDKNNGPDPEALLEMYSRFKAATKNGNLGRMMYDRNTNQAIQESMSYYVGGGQVLNWDIDITNGWSLTDNLSIVEESPIYRRAFMGGSMGVFADGNEEYTKSCQTTFNDFKPVKTSEDYKKRPKNQNVCFSKTQIPITQEFTNQQRLIKIYEQIEQRDTGSFFNIGQVINQVVAMITQKINGQIRTSPVATTGLGIDVNLSPDFDGYSTQIYGLSATGAETNGEAFENIWSGAEAMWTRGLTDDTYGIGAQYQTDKEVSQSLQKAQKIDKIAMTYRPFKDRMLAISNPDSLLGRVAMLSPTNREDGSKKMAWLLSPGNISSSIASRFVPSSLAQSNSSSLMVNPMNAARMGYNVSDPSNFMDSMKLWTDYKCDEGGPTQTKQMVGGADMPFNVPINTNPCKREKTISTVTTCWFTKDDDCSLDGQASGARSGEEEPSTGDSTNPPTGDQPDQPVDESQTAVTNGCGGIRVHKSIVQNVEALCAAAKADGLNLTGSGWRSTESQIALRIAHGCGGAKIYDKSCKGSPPTAVPGRSNHEKGLAIDFRNCNSHGTACYKWLAANAGKFGLYNLPSEAWHWSVNGK